MSYHHFYHLVSKLEFFYFYYLLNVNFYYVLDCQDLLCRLLDPTPAKRIKMSEIFSHPWLNYNCFPVEIIPYKPVVDLKEIKPQIVQYLVQK